MDKLLEAERGSDLLKVLVFTMMSAVLCHGTLRAEDWITLYDKDQNGIEVRIVGATDSAVTVERKYFSVKVADDFF